MVYKDAKEDKEVKVRGRDRETKTPLKLTDEEGGGASRGTMRSVVSVKEDHGNRICDIICGMS